MVNAHNTPDEKITRQRKKRQGLRSGFDLFRYHTRNNRHLLGSIGTLSVKGERSSSLLNIHKRLTVRIKIMSPFIRGLLLLLALSRVSSFSLPLLEKCFRTTSSTSILTATNQNENDDEAWDSDVDYDKALPEDPNDDKVPDPTLGWNVPKESVPTPKLGIDIGQLLEPLSEKEAAELKAAATEVINEAVAAGIDEIDALRAKMKKELEEKKKQMQRESERNMEQASASLMNRIDTLTDAFLANTTLSRTSTKLAAQADQAMVGRGVDMGTWGTLGGATVVAGTTGLAPETSSGLSAGSDATSSSEARQASRILVVADTKSDNYAKQLIGPLSKTLEQVLPDIEVQVIRPTESWPLGGNDAAAVLLFLTSLSDASSVKNGLERLLRQTMSAGGKLAQPPTQIIAISSVGTARTDQMPYSMQNLFSGQLEKRKQMEEAVQKYVETCEKARPPFLDYTICKLGEIKGGSKEAFALRPGDVLDGTLDLDSAVAVMKQAIALQPAARNATLCSTGGSVADMSQEEWDDAFLQLDGPEIWRVDLSDTEGEYDQLVEYMLEWSQLPATSKGLTTPIRIEEGKAVCPLGVSNQRSIQMLYLPTSTGDRYMSRDEEKERERERDSYTTSSDSGNVVQKKKPTKEGGIEILIETTETPKQGMRVRVRRTNYAPGVVIKELTESSLLSRVKKTVDVWRSEHTKN